MMNEELEKLYQRLQNAIYDLECEYEINKQETEMYYAQFDASKCD